ncbi:MAG TPA: hypothetical protein VF498_13040 [Anaerolineales bacterium]
MCTSFAVYTTRPLYGMNFDFPQAPIWLRLKPGAQGDVFYLCFEREGAIHATAGLNAAGLFAASQILVAHFEMEPAADTEDWISPYEIFIRSLQTGESVADVLAILGERRLAYSPDRKGHQLYADCQGSACILEPGPRGNRVYRSNGPCMVMTNRPAQKEMDRAAGNITRLGVDRYQIASQLIEARRDRFDIEDGFEVLRQVMLIRGRFTTQASMVLDPQAGEVYLALRKDFSRVWKVDIRERSVQAFEGFAESWKAELDERGVLLG